MNSSRKLNPDGLTLIEPTALRVGWAPKERRIVLQVTLPAGTTVAYALHENAAYVLATQIANIGVERGKRPSEGS